MFTEDHGEHLGRLDSLLLVRGLVEVVGVGVEGRQLPGHLLRDTGGLHPEVSDVGETLLGEVTKAVPLQPVHTCLMERVDVADLDGLGSKRLGEGSIINSPILEIEC